MTTDTLRIGIAGLGTVGGGVVKILQSNADLITARSGRKIEVVAVSARDKSRDRGFSTDGLRWFDDARDLAADSEIDVVLEMIGGSEGIARDVCEKALSTGKHVVTANKALIAHHGKALAALAAGNNLTLAFEAAVAGGIPVIKTLREGMAANRFFHISGILNGTCNYILTTMEKTGQDFADVLKEAQEKGYAEADPTFDVDGIDTAHKLAIMAGLAFGHAPNMDELPVEGIRSITFDDIRYANELGYRIKLLGVTRMADGHVQQAVYPCMVAKESPLGSVDDAFNAVQLEGDFVGRIFLEGAGAGEGPTASSVVADLVDIARGTTVPTLNVQADSLKDMPFSSLQDSQNCYYLRLNVLDKPGVLAEVTNILKDAGVSMKDVSQHAGKEDEPVHIVLTTHMAKEANMKQALQRVEALDTVIEAPQLIRIEA